MSMVTIFAYLVTLSVYAIMGGGILFLISLIIRSERKVKEKSCNVYRENAILEGMITDAALVQERSSKPYRYRYAVLYRDQNGQDRRAFIGIQTDRVLSYAVGMKVVLRQFPRTLVPLREEDKRFVLDPMRGADGRVPERVRFTVFQGTAMDETGTLMLESDYETMMDHTNHSISQMKKASKVLNIIGLVLLVPGVLLLVGSICFILNMRSNATI